MSFPLLSFFINCSPTISSDWTGSSRKSFFFFDGIHFWDSSDSSVSTCCREHSAARTSTATMLSETSAKQWGITLTFGSQQAFHGAKLRVCAASNAAGRAVWGGMGCDTCSYCCIHSRLEQQPHEWNAIIIINGAADVLLLRLLPAAHRSILYYRHRQPDACFCCHGCRLSCWINSICWIPQMCTGMFSFFFFFFAIARPAVSSAPRQKSLSTMWGMWQNDSSALKNRKIPFGTFFKVSFWRTVHYFLS